MEISAFEIYLLMQADSIRVGIVMLTTMLPIFLLFWLPAFEEFGNEACMPWFKRHLAACFVFLTLALLVPDTKTLAAMYVGPEILSRINLDRVEQEGNEVWEIGNEALRNIGKPEQSKKEVE